MSDELERVGRYIVGRRAYGGAWEDDAMRTATRDAAVLAAMSRSAKTGQHHYVVDVHRFPNVEIGYAREGVFVWADWIVTEYAQPKR